METATDGVDYQSLSGTAVIPGGQAGVTITTPIIADALAEGTETAVLTISPDPAYGLGAASATRYIPDDEVPAETVGFATASGSGDEGIGTVNVPVTVSAPAGDPVTVEYEVTGGSATGMVDYTLVSGLLTFDPGETSMDIPLTIIDDVFDEPDQTVTIGLRNAWGAALGTDTYTYTITDNDDPPPPTVGFAALTSNLPEGTPGTILVSLTTSEASPVTVDYDLSGGSATAGEDFLLLPGTLTFAPGETIRSIPITVAADLLTDPNETIEVTLSMPSGAALGANTLHSATITDMPVVVVDTDGDGLPDPWEIANGFDPLDDGSGMAINGAQGDGDGDGMDNQTEFVLCKDPTVSDPPATEVSFEVNPMDGKTYLNIQYTRRVAVPTILIEPEVTQNLGSWSGTPSDFEEISVTLHPDGECQTVVLRILPAVEDGGGRGFARLRISPAPPP